MISHLRTNLRIAAFLGLFATVALARQQTAPDATSAAKPDATASPNGRADAYYHYALAHMYEELVAMYGRSEFASRAIDEYRAAIQADPNSEYLNAGLAELYFKTGRIREAITESQQIVDRDPNNLDARKLLGRIYLRSLGDTQNGAQSEQVLKLAIDQYNQIVRLEPNDADNHLLLGRLYMLSKDLTKAESEFKAARQIQPDSEEAVSNLAYLYNEEGDTTRAIEIIRSVPDDQRSARLYAALGYTYEQQHDYANAVDAYQHSVDLDKDNLDARRGLAQNLLNAGKQDAALEQFRQIADQDPQDAQAYLRISDILRRQGKFDDALMNLKKAESLVQDSVEVPFNEALIYEQQGKFDDAAALLQKLIDASNKPVASMTDGERNNLAVFEEHLASVYHDQGKTQAQIDMLRKMITLGGEASARGYQQLVDAYRDAREWDQATEAAKEAVQKMPKDRGANLILASQLADTGEAEKGIALAKSLLDGTSQDREIYLTLGEMDLRLKRWKDSEEALHKADTYSSKPEDKAYVEFMLGSLFERQKRYDAAEQEFRQVLSSDPKNTMTLNYLGYMMADHGQHLEEALAMIKKAVEQEPQNGAYLDSLGWANFKLGNFDQAEEYLREASDRMPTDPTVHDHLGDLYMRTGRLKLAAAQWERSIDEYSHALPLDVDQNDVTKVQHKLESARVKLAKETTSAK